MNTVESIEKELGIRATRIGGDLWEKIEQNKNRKKENKTKTAAACIISGNNNNNRTPFKRRYGCLFNDINALQAHTGNNTTTDNDDCVNKNNND